jgi:hypothetical protein
MHTTMLHMKPDYLRSFPTQTELTRIPISAKPSDPVEPHTPVGPKAQVELSSSFGKLTITYIDAATAVATMLRQGQFAWEQSKERLGITSSGAKEVKQLVETGFLSGPQ